MDKATSAPITWEDFTKVEMRVGTILSAEPFKEARNPSCKMVVDFGPYGKRKTSAQITKRYRPEDLSGLQVIGVLNFSPKQIANMRSECLVLGAIGESGMVTLIAPEAKIENGLRIG